MFIRLNSIKIFAHHGVYDEEINNGNNFEIDIEIELPDSFGATTDALVDVLDYTKLYQRVVSISENHRYNLLEAFSCDICIKILETFSVVQYVGVKLRKMNPPMGGEVMSVEVEFKKRRENA